MCTNKDDQVKQITNIKEKIEKISGKINGYIETIDSTSTKDATEEHDLSLRKVKNTKYIFRLHKRRR